MLPAQAPSQVRMFCASARQNVCFLSVRKRPLYLGACRNERRHLNHCIGHWRDCGMSEVLGVPRANGFRDSNFWNEHGWNMRIWPVVIGSLVHLCHSTRVKVWKVSVMDYPCAVPYKSILYIYSIHNPFLFIFCISLHCAFLHRCIGPALFKRSLQLESGISSYFNVCNSGFVALQLPSFFFLFIFVDLCLVTRYFFLNLRHYFLFF